MRHESLVLSKVRGYLFVACFFLGVGLDLACLIGMK